MWTNLFSLDFPIYYFMCPYLTTGPVNSINRGQLHHINLEMNRNPCQHSWRNLFSVFEISLCVCLSGTFLLISTSIVGDISRYIDTAYYLGYTNCPSIHVRSYTDLSLTIYFPHFYYPPKQPLLTQL